MTENNFFITRNLYHGDCGIRTWVSSAINDEILHLQRQTVATFLVAIGLDHTLSDHLVLKGGALMALVYKSTRTTSDIDLTATSDPKETVDYFDRLNDLMRRAAFELGYASLRTRIQTLKKLPKAAGFENFEAPALKLTIAYAKQNTQNEKKLNNGQCPTIIEVDISFKEKIYEKTELHLTDDFEIKIFAYSIIDMISEKLRATLQQSVRNRSRRQDIYDIAFLLKKQPITEEIKHDIHTSLLEKCSNRDFKDFVVNRDSLDNPDVRSASMKDWDTMKLEIELPDFNECYELVRNFYRSLPWEK